MGGGRRADGRGKLKCVVAGREVDSLIKSLQLQCACSFSLFDVLRLNLDSLQWRCRS